MIENPVMQLGIRVCEITIENEWRMRTARYKDGTYRLFVAILLGIIRDHEHYLSQTWNASQLR